MKVREIPEVKALITAVEDLQKQVEANAVRADFLKKSENRTTERLQAVRDEHYRLETAKIALHNLRKAARDALTKEQKEKKGQQSLFTKEKNQDLFTQLNITSFKKLHITSYVDITLLEPVSKPLTETKKALDEIALSESIPAAPKKGWKDRILPKKQEQTNSQELTSSKTTEQILEEIDQAIADDEPALTRNTKPKISQNLNNNNNNAQQSTIDTLGSSSALRKRGLDWSKAPKKNQSNNNDIGLTNLSASTTNTNSTQSDPNNNNSETFSTSEWVRDDLFLGENPIKDLFDSPDQRKIPDSVVSDDLNQLEEQLKALEEQAREQQEQQRLAQERAEQDRQQQEHAKQETIQAQLEQQQNEGRKLKLENNLREVQNGIKSSVLLFDEIARRDNTSSPVNNSQIDNFNERVDTYFSKTRSTFTPENAQQIQNLIDEGMILNKSLRELSANIASPRSASHVQPTSGSTVSNSASTSTTTKSATPTPSSSNLDVNNNNNNSSTSPISPDSALGDSKPPVPEFPDMDSSTNSKDSTELHSTRQKTTTSSTSTTQPETHSATPWPSVGREIHDITDSTQSRKGSLMYNRDKTSNLNSRDTLNLNSRDTAAYGDSTDSSPSDDDQDSISGNDRENDNNFNDMSERLADHLPTSGNNTSINDLLSLVPEVEPALEEQHSTRDSSEEESESETHSSGLNGSSDDSSESETEDEDETLSSGLSGSSDDSSESETEDETLSSSSSSSSNDSSSESETDSSSESEAEDELTAPTATLVQQLLVAINGIATAPPPVERDIVLPILTNLLHTNNISQADFNELSPNANRLWLRNEINVNPVGALQAIRRELVLLDTPSVLTNTLVQTQNNLTPLVANVNAATTNLVALRTQLDQLILSATPYRVNPVTQATWDALINPATTARDAINTLVAADNLANRENAHQQLNNLVGALNGIAAPDDAAAQAVANQITALRAGTAINNALAITLEQVLNNINFAAPATFVDVANQLQTAHGFITRNGIDQAPLADHLNAARLALQAVGAPPTQVQLTAASDALAQLKTTVNNLGRNGATPYARAAQTLETRLTQAINNLDAHLHPLAYYTRELVRGNPHALPAIVGLTDAITAADRGQIALVLEQYRTNLANHVPDSAERANLIGLLETTSDSIRPPAPPATAAAQEANINQLIAALNAAPFDDITSNAYRAAQDANIQLDRFKREILDIRPDPNANPANQASLLANIAALKAQLTPLTGNADADAAITKLDLFVVPPAAGAAGPTLQRNVPNIQAEYAALTTHIQNLGARIDQTQARTTLQNLRAVYNLQQVVPALTRPNIPAGMFGVAPAPAARVMHPIEAKLTSLIDDKLTPLLRQYHDPVTHQAIINAKDILTAFRNAIQANQPIANQAQVQAQFDSLSQNLNVVVNGSTLNANDVREVLNGIQTVYPTLDYPLVPTANRLVLPNLGGLPVLSKDQLPEIRYLSQHYKSSGEQGRRINILVQHIITKATDAAHSNDPNVANREINELRSKAIELWRNLEAYERYLRSHAEDSQKYRDHLAQVRNWLHQLSSLLVSNGHLNSTAKASGRVVTYGKDQIVGNNAAEIETALNNLGVGAGPAAAAWAAPVNNQNLGLAYNTNQARVTAIESFNSTLVGVVTRVAGNEYRSEIRDLPERSMFSFFKRGVSGLDDADFIPMVKWIQITLRDKVGVGQLKLGETNLHSDDKKALYIYICLLEKYGLISPTVFADTKDNLKEKYRNSREVDDLFARITRPDSKYPPDVVALLKPIAEKNKGRFAPFAETTGIKESESAAGIKPKNGR